MLYQEDISTLQRREKVDEQVVTYGLFALGVVLSILIPYGIEWANDRVKFSAKYVVGRLLGAALAIMPFLTGMVDTLEGIDPVGAFVYGWFASSVGRQAQKVYDLGKSKLGNGG